METLVTVLIFFAPALVLLGITIWNDHRQPTAHRRETWPPRK
jgi:hypothetical protein